MKISSQFHAVCSDSSVNNKQTEKCVMMKYLHLKVMTPNQILVECYLYSKTFCYSIFLLGYVRCLHFVIMLVLDVTMAIFVSELN